MIRGGAGNARSRLNHIEPIHRVGRAVQLASARKFSGVANVSRAAAEEIRIERKDDVGLFRAVNRVEVTAESELRTFARAVADGRVPLMPLSLGKECQERLNLCCERGGCDKTGQDTETRAVRTVQPR